MKKVFKFRHVTKNRWARECCFQPGMIFFFGKVEGGSPNKREACWWVVSDDQSIWHVLWTSCVSRRIEWLARCDVIELSRTMWISEPMTSFGQ